MRCESISTLAARRLRAVSQSGSLLLAVLSLAACSGPPAVNILGSYFPAWMLCALIGIVAAICLRLLLVLTEIENVLVAPLLTHAAVALAVTLGVWLLWFGH